MYPPSYVYFFFLLSADHRDLHVLTHSFPTRRSSDLEYIWFDGTKPTAKLRSKTKIVEDGVKPADLPIWGFDGSSTNQAPGDASDCVLQPVFTCPDPIRSEEHTSELQSLMRISYAVFC